VGTFADFLGASRTLYTQVDFPIGQTRFPFVTTSWEPGEGNVIITDPDPPPDPDPDPEQVPEPGTMVLLGLGAVVFGARRMRG
jgi:hypothetical protein